MFIIVFSTVELPFAFSLRVIQKRTRTRSHHQAADALRQARKQIYDFLYANSPPSVRAAIGSLQVCGRVLFSLCPRARTRERQQSGMRLGGRDKRIERRSVQNRGDGKSNRYQEKWITQFVSFD